MRVSPLAIATSLDHILHPFKAPTKGSQPTLSPQPIWKKVTGVALFIIASLTLVWGAVLLASAFWKARAIKKMAEKDKTSSEIVFPKVTVAKGTFDKFNALELQEPLVKYVEKQGLAGVEPQVWQVLDALEKGGRGFLFYGPPGTGKSTFANEIGHFLGCSGERLIKLNAVEIQNISYSLAKSEKGIQKIFEPAREAKEKYKENCPLYMVVIDEIDALFNYKNMPFNKFKESLTSHFLIEMWDLIEQGNFLIVGITNKKEEIDPLALRQGRLGSHVDFELPHIKKREQIIKIHTSMLERENLLDKSVDMKILAEKTEGLSCADIKRLVEEASVLALERLAKLKCSDVEIKKHPDGLVTMMDFEKALKWQKQDQAFPESFMAMYV